MTASNGPEGNGGGLRLDDLDLQPCPIRLGPELSQHPGREVDGRDAVAQFRRDKTEEPGSGTHIENPCRSHRQESLKGAPPRGPLQGRDGVMPRVKIIGGSVSVPEMTDLVDRFHIHRKRSLAL
jgi:hypothetical protein